MMMNNKQEQKTELNIFRRTINYFSPSAFRDLFENNNKKQLALRIFIIILIITLIVLVILGGMKYFVSIKTFILRQFDALREKIAKKQTGNKENQN